MNKRILSIMLTISLIAASGVPQYAWAEENVDVVSESESFYDEQQDENTVESNLKSDVDEIEFENLNNMQETSETDDFLEDASQMESSIETSEIDIQDANVASDFSYIILDDGTVGITGYTGSNRRNLVIPEEIDGKKVTKIMDNAFHLERDSFKGSLTIPEGITYIGKYAFAFNVFSGNLYIPNTVIEIGEGAFYDDLFSGDLIIPDSVEIIGDLAFAGTYFDGKLKLSKNLKTIGKSAFSTSSFTGNLNIPDGVVSIGEEAFTFNHFYGDITIPDSVKVIGKKAFFRAHVTSTFGNIIINHMPENIDSEAFISGYDLPDINMTIGSELGVGQTRIGKITAMCMRFAYPLAINWKSSNPSIAKVNEKGEITAISEGSVVITAELYNGISVSGDLEVVGYDVDTKEDNYNICIGPERSKLSNLWTGDEVTIGWNAYEGRNKDISTVEILSGEKLITVKALEPEYGYWSVSCNSAGTAKLRIKFKSDVHEPVDITLKIKEKPAKDDVKYNPSMKIGEMGYKVQCLNVSYGKDPTICLSPKDKEKMYIEFENTQESIPSYKRVVDGNLVKFSTPTDWYPWYDYALFPVTPGKIQLLYYQDYSDDYEKKNPILTFTVNIEEPVINNNIKNEYEINDTADIVSTLDNTAFKDVKDPQTLENWYQKNLYYTPKLEVVSGQDCVKILKDAEITTLSLKESIQFIKAGTVTFKISYEPTGSLTEECNLYRPEKTITVTVKDDKKEEPTSDPVDAFVSRLYKNILGRDTDAAGLKAWSDVLKSGKEQGAKVAQGFVDSQEMKNRNLSDDDYIKALYQTFLNREADAAGLAAWKNVLDSGLSRMHVFKGFAESQEFTEICERYGIERGNAELTAPRDQNEGVTKFVVRCYRLCLGRDADESGLNGWCNAILTGKNTAKQAAAGFVFSDEFKKKNLSDTEYVKTLYRVFMDREADGAGLNAWVKVLRSGKSREHVFNGFADSNEFREICARYGIK